MKKNLFTVAAVALVAFVSCNKETNSPVQPAPVSDIKFEAEIAQTKTAIGKPDSEGNRDVTWVLGDQVNINGTLFTATGFKEDGKAIFETENLDFATAEQYDAIYPATAGTSLEAVTIAAKQDGTFASAGVAVAQSENRSLAFMNVASIIKFQVPAAYASVTVESTANLAGTVSVTFDEDGTPVIGNVENASKVITLEKVEAGVDYYVAILPGDHKFTFNIDGRLSKEASKTLTATRAGILALGVLPMPKANRNLAFTETAVSATRGTDLIEPKLNGVTDDVTYTSSNTSVATVNAKTGEVTMLTKGETIITASAPESNTHVADEASYTLTVEPVYYSVYVCISDVKWNNVNMHRFTSSGDLTDWPGETLSETVSVNSKTYYKKLIEENTTLSFTFNNGKDGANFKIDVPEVTVNGDIYYRLSARGAIEVDPNDVKTFGYAIYVFDQKSKNVAPNLYAWNDKGAWNAQYGGDFFAWPGVAFKNDCYYVPANGEKWRHYYYYEIPTDLYNTTFNYIVNKKGQTSDLTSKSVNGDLYVGYWYNNDNENGFWVDNASPTTPITNFD